MYFDATPNGDHAPKRTSAHIHAAYRRLFTLIKTVKAPNEIARPVIMTFLGFFGASGAAMAHTFDDGARIVSAIGTLAHMENADIDFKRPIVQNFFNAKAPLCITRESASQELLEMTHYARFESLILTPVVIDTCPIGIIAISSDTPNYFCNDDAQTLFELTRFLGMLIGAREREIDSQLRLNYQSLKDATAGIAPQLHKGVIELIQTFAQLRNYYAKQQYQRIAEPLSAAVGNIENMAKATQSLNALAEICTFKVDATENIAIAPLLENVVDYNRTQINEIAKLSLHIANDIPEINGDFSLIWQAVHELIQNALQALKRSGRDDKQLTVKAYPLPNYAAIEIIDNGCGVEPADLPHLFDPFFTRWQAVRGLGLTRARMNLLKLNGQIYGRPADNGGMIFKILLPDARHIPQIEIF